VRALAAIGVVRFDSSVTDGHSEFFGADGHSVVSSAHHELLHVADVSDRGAFLNHLRDHGDGETSYVEISTGLAQSGVEKWFTDTTALTMAYCPREGIVRLVDDITATPIVRARTCRASAAT